MGLLNLDKITMGLHGTALPCSGGYHMERGGMPLHDAVGINCNKGAITEHQDSAVKYMG